MEKHTLKAVKRTITGRKIKKLRKEGLIPANIYGKDVKSLAIQVDSKEFAKVFTGAGETSLVEVAIDGEKRPVLIHNLQYHPVSGEVLHVDFLQVDLKQKVTTKVPLHFAGEAPAVKDKVGTLLTILSEVEIEALPGDLPDKFDVNLDSLTKVGDTFKVSQISVTEKVKVLTSADTEIVKVAPLISKEAEAMAKETEAAAAAAASTAEAAGTEAAPSEGAKSVESVPKATTPAIEDTKTK